jgi:hypothetical protein
MDWPQRNWFQEFVNSLCKPGMYEGCPVSKVLWSIKIQWQDITTLNFARHVCVFGSIPEHIVAIYPSWYKFKNSIMLEVRLLHMQQLMESLFHFLIFCGISSFWGIASTVQTDDLLCVTVVCCKFYLVLKSTVLEQHSSHRPGYLTEHASCD